MKYLLKTVLILSTVFVVTSCSPGNHLSDSKAVILPLSNPDALRDGTIVYGLPRTVFTVVADLQRTIEKPGPYAQYADDLLGLNNVIKNESESWTIERITVKSHDEIDPSEFYVISSTSLFQTNVLALKKEGLILDLNPAFLKSEQNGNLTEAGKTSD